MLAQRSALLYNQESQTSQHGSQVSDCLISMGNDKNTVSFILFIKFQTHSHYHFAQHLALLKINVPSCVFRLYSLVSNLSVCYNCLQPNKLANSCPFCINRYLKKGGLIARANNPKFLDYFSFAIVRNPWRRLVSVYIQKFVETRQGLSFCNIKKRMPKLFRLVSATKLLLVTQNLLKALWYLAIFSCFLGI